MSVQKLVLWPNPLLKLVSEEVDPEWILSDDAKRLVKDLSDTLMHFGGVGLSAIQVAYQARLFVMRTKEGDKWVVKPFFNPELVATDGELAEVEEGCLSLPGIVEKVKRYPNVVISALDPSGIVVERRSYDLEGIEAQCAQHELEHLDGKTMGDDWGPVKRDIVKRKIRKTMRAFNRYIAYQEANQ